MFNFNKANYEDAKLEAKKVENTLLMDEVEKVKAFVEKVLTACLESTANRTRVSYPGADI